MQYSIINKNSLVSDMRLDAEAYWPLFFDIEEQIRKHRFTTLRKECSLFVKGIFDIKASCYMERGGIPFVRISNLKNMIISENDIIHIPESEDINNKKTSLNRGDIILSKTAYPAASFVNLRNCNVSQDTIAVKLRADSEVKSHYLVLFLNSQYGFLQMKRWFTGNIQMHLNLTDGRNIEIPIFSQKFQEMLGKLFESSIDHMHKSQSFYLQAEQLLLSELELLDWKPNHQLTFIQNFSNTEQAEHFDADYFQPKYEALTEILKKYKYGINELGGLVQVKDRNFTPKENENYKYIELANIASNGEITGYTESLGNELPSRARRKVQKGDVIVSSIEGSLESIALITEDWKNALCSTGFFVINSDHINSETLLVLLKTKVGQMQLKRGCKGTILTAIGKDEFCKIVLPKISIDTQNTIKEKISQMYTTKNLSKALLEVAKQGVEMAIEKDEQTAEKWIDNEVKKLTID